MKQFNILFLAVLFSISSAFSQESSLNEGFEGMPSGQPLVNGWTTITANPGQAGIRNSSGNAKSGSQYAFIYTFFTANDEVYFVTPLLDMSLGGSVDFWLGASGQPSSPTTYQTGILTDASNVSTFSPIGSETNLPVAVGTAEEPASPVYENIVETIPVDAVNKYFAVKIKTTKNHTALYLDDFIWNQTLSTNQFNTASFALYPNPTVNKIVNLALQSTNNEVTITSVTGQIVYKNTVNRSAQLNLQHLKAGLYLVNVSSEIGSVTKKLVLN